MSVTAQTQPRTRTAQVVCPAHLLVVAARQVGILATNSQLSSETALGTGNLNQIHVKTESDQLVLATTCAAGNVVTRVRHHGAQGELSCTLDPHAFLHAVGSLSDRSELVLQQLADGTVRIRAGESLFKLSSSGEAIPPKLVEAPPRLTVQLTEQALGRVVKQVVPYTASRTMGRPQLENVSLTFQDGVLTAAASDTIQLAALRLDSPQAHPPEPIVITVTPFALKTLWMLARQMGELTLQVYDSQLRATVHSEQLETVVTLNLVSLVMPNFERFLNNADYLYTIRIDPSELRRALRVASNANADYFYLYSSRGALYGIYTAPSGSYVTRLESELQFHTESDRVRVCLSPKRFRSAVESMLPADTLRVSQAQKLPAIYLQSEEPGYLHILTLIADAGTDLDSILAELDQSEPNSTLFEEPDLSEDVDGAEETYGTADLPYDDDLYGYGYDGEDL